MLDQRVQTQTTHLNERYERLIADYEELRQLIMKMRSQMDGTYASPNWPHAFVNDQPHHPPTLPLF
jgi:hypothetical protein